MEEINNIYLVSILVLVCFSGIFSCCETSITAVSHAKIHQLKGQGDKRAIKLDKLLQQREKVVSAMLVGNNAVNILASALAASISIKMFGEAGLFYATFIMTAIVLIFAEIAPKTFAIRAPEKMLLIFFPIIWFIVNFLYPLINILQKVVNSFVAIFFPAKSSKSNPEELAEIRSTIELKAIEGSIVKKDKDLLEGVLDLSDIDISEIMVYRKDIESIDINLEKSKIINLALNSNFSRIPLWQEDKENIVGILNSKKLAKEIYDAKQKKLNIEDVDLKKVISDPVFVPTTNRLKSQLDQFRKNRSKIALVIDEYGSLQGLITVQDIIEEIVGEVKDSDDSYGFKVIKTRSGGYKVSAKMLIRDLNKMLNWDIEESDDAYNISAFAINNLGRIPQKGENFVIDGYSFEILKRSDYQLEQVKIQQIDKNE